MSLEDDDAVSALGGDSEETGASTGEPIGRPFPEELRPSVEHLILDDGKPVDSLFFEKLMRLMTEALYSSWNGPGGGRPFLVCADVGLFFEPKQTPLVPDIMLSLDVRPGDLSVKENQSYFLWIMGKPPEAVVEFVSDRTGGELTYKMQRYAQVGIAYYVVFDPRNLLRQGVLRAFRRVGTQYEEIDAAWLAGIGLGVRLWEGEFEGEPGNWLRWCDEQRNVIPTGAERSLQEKQRADQEKRHAREEKRRASEAKRQATAEKKRADQEKKRADQEKKRADSLAAKLRKLGIDPDAP